MGPAEWARIDEALKTSGRVSSVDKPSLGRKLSSMHERAKPLWSVRAIPGWLLTLWGGTYKLINLASNADWVQNHAAQMKPMWDFFLENNYWFALVAGLLWLSYLVAHPQPAKPLKIIAAKYGRESTYKDVKTILEGYVANNCIDVAVTQLARHGDPFPNEIKELKVVYSLGDGQQKRVVKHDDDRLVIPEP